MNTPQSLIVHHTGVSRNKNSCQFDAVNSYHKRKGWGGIGYHYLIEPDGTVKAGRKENEPGAHTKEQGVNSKSLGLCLTGNFDVEEPTQEQCEALSKLISELSIKYAIPDAQVFAHRHYATYKSCWGGKLPNDVLGYLKSRLNASALEPWQQELYDWAALDIQDMGKLLEGNIWSLLALIKRKVH